MALDVLTAELAIRVIELDVFATELASFALELDVRTAELDDVGRRPSELDDL